MADRVEELVARLHDSANANTTDPSIENIVTQTRALFRRRDRSAGVGKFPKFTNYPGDTRHLVRKIKHRQMQTNYHAGFVCIETV